MAIFEESFGAFLVALNVVGGRIYAQRLPQRPTYPAISFFRVTSRGLQALSGGPSAWQQASMQVDVWSQDYAEAKTITESLRQALEGYVGSIGGRRASVGDFTSRDQYVDDAQPPAVHHVIVECAVWFEDE